MVWPKYCGQNGDNRDPRDNPEFQRQMEVSQSMTILWKDYGLCESLSILKSF